MFAGGCAVTHRALEVGKYKEYLANDLGMGPAFFVDCVNGRYKDEDKWISREEFHKHKGDDPYIKYCWSFGFNGMDYCYGQACEADKKALWEYAQAGNRIPLKKRLQTFETLHSINNLIGIVPVDHLTLRRVDYREVPIANDSVIYCDIPYKGSNIKGYVDGTFDYSRFYDWCKEQKELVIISEREMPMDDFVSVAQKHHRYTLSKENNNFQVIEKLFVPKHQLSLYKERMAS